MPGPAPKTVKKPVATPTTRPSAWNSPISPTNAIFQESGNDERGRVQNRIVDEAARYRGQMDPFLGSLGEGYGGALETDAATRNNIMGQYSGIAGGGNNINPQSIKYSDPFASYGKFNTISNTGGYDPNNEAYAGYKGFSETGGYSSQDIDDLRARGVSPIRAAYANAGREVSRQRSLQGGYSPNATAVLAKMAREQGQAGADALQNVNAGIIDSRNAGKLSGLSGMAGIDVNRINNQFKGMTGMSDIETQRLQAELDANKFNANARMQTDQWNAGNKIAAINGMNSLYGTTPGMTNMFSNQIADAIARSGAQGSSYIQQENAAQQLPGRYENTQQYVNDIATASNPFLDYLKKKNQTTTPPYNPNPTPGNYTTPLGGQYTITR